MGKYKYLAGNIALFSISNFVSKILVFLLVPFYTNVLTTTEYGIADIFQVTLLLLVPALTINIGEAALRFGIEKTELRGSILYAGLKYVLMASTAVAVACGIASFFVNGEICGYLLFFSILFLTNALFEFMILYFQGCEMVQIVVIGSVLSTLVMILCNLYFLLVMKIGLNGYLFSQMIAYSVATVVMLLLRKPFSGTKQPVKADPELEKEMLRYGGPLILYSTGSWINNAADRYLVAAICGAAVNGVYGVAYKIPAILMVFQRIFAQAWQMSATKSYKDNKSDEFFTTMYSTYHTFMVIGCSVLILVVRPVATFMFRKEFYEAWAFVPPLLISVVFGALTGFLGSISLAHKDSKAMGLATGCGAALNVGLNLLLIPKFGAMGAAVATAFSYFTMYFMALMITRKYVKIKAKFVRDYIAYLALVGEALVMILVNSDLAYGICAGLVMILLVMHISEVRNIVSKLTKVLLRKESLENSDGKE